MANYIGTDAGEAIVGGAGDDRITGRGGNDTLTGGAGNDVFVYDTRGFGYDWIVDFDTNGDRIDLSYLHVADFASLRHFATQDGADVVIALGYGASAYYSENIRLKNVALSSLSDADFVFNTSPVWLNVTGGYYGNVLFGGNGNDLISGGTYWDSLVGGGGNDRLIGGASDDWLMGGAGNDIFVYSGRRFGHDTIADFDTNGDRIDLSYLNVADISSLRPFMAQDGNDVVIDLGSLGFEESIRIENVALESLSNADFVFNTSTVGLTIDGGHSGSVLFGGAGDDRIVGGTGRLVGGAGNDIFVYRPNLLRDTIFDFNTNGDRIDLSALHVPDFGDLLPFMTQDGNDVVITLGDGKFDYGESIRLLNVSLGSLSAADFIFDTSTGADTVYGTEFDDVLFGGAGNDALFGHVMFWLPYDDGDDRLFGGDGDDLLSGGRGADRLDGGAGIDTARYYTSLAGVTVDLSTGATSGGDAWGDILVSIENVSGSGYNDTLIGNAGANTLYGSNGNDLLRGGAGADRLDGSLDTDTVSYYNGSIGVTVDLSVGTGLGGDAQGDTLIGIENVSGSQGNDRLTGNSVANILQGWNGDDVLQGGFGADRLDGGAGIDTASYADSWAGVTADLSTGIGRGGDAEGDILASIENLDGSQKADTLIGNAGANRLDGGAGSDTVGYSNSSIGVTVDLAAGTGSGGDARGDILVSIENVEGSQANDQLTGNAGANVLKGSGGNDVLRGGAGADYLDGGAGIDTASYYTATGSVSADLSVRAGSAGDAKGDVLIKIENLTGGQGNDVLGGDSGVNILQGWAGDDTLRGGAGPDRLDGGAGSDTASYYNSWAGVSVNLSTGAAGLAEAQGDILVSIENLGGSQYADTLIGNAGANTLQGWNGNDVLRGGAGKDTLTGGAGADRFVYIAAGDTVVGANADRITDFSRAQLDRIDLAAIDANSAVAGDQGFSFIGSGLFTRHAGELRFSVAGSVTTISGDVNGDGVADVQITLTGSVSLQASDFVL